MMCTYAYFLILCFAVIRSHCQAVCGGTFTSSSGTIQSPNFPQEHPHNQNCTYLITAPEGYRITLNFTTLDLEASVLSRCFDYVEIRNGGDETAPLFGRFCKQLSPLVRRSFENKLWIRFHSDSSFTSRGFNATYTAVPSNNTFLLVTSSGSTSRSRDGAIFRVDPDTISNYRVQFPSDIDNPIAVDYDPVDERIYWTENGFYEGGIRSAFLNGSDLQVVLNVSRAANIDGIAVDYLSRLVFYTDAGNARVAMVTMASFAHKTVVSTDVDNPRAIVLNMKDGVMYWTDWGTPTKIERANYDGSDRRTLVNTNLTYPNGLAIDFQNNKLYWVDAGTDMVESSDLDGNQRTVLYRGLSTEHFFGLALFENTLYITDWGSSGASSTRSYILEQQLASGTTNVSRIGSIAERLNDIHAYHENRVETEPNGCGRNNGGCSVICIPLPSNGKKCACPDGQILSDTTTCVQGPTTIPVPTTTTPAPAACDQNFTALTGTIQSPNFPNRHANNLNCTYIITAPEGYRITLNFTDLDLESSFLSSRCFDYVEIRDGHNASAPLFGRYCDHTLPFQRRSFGNRLWIRFVTDSSVSNDGFSATYTSERTDDFFLLLTSSGKVSTLYDGAIFRVDPETMSNYRVPMSLNLDNPIAVDYDPVEQRIYWTESSSLFNRIRSSRLNGSDIQTVYSSLLTAVLDGIAVDPVSRLIFYTDAGYKRVAMLTMSKPHKRKIIATSQVENPRAIVLDTANGVVYWTDWGAQSKIERANYDGSDRTTLVSLGQGYTNGLAIDVANNKLYWADASTDKVETSDLEGNGRTLLYQGSSSQHFFGLVYFQNTLFLTDWGLYGSRSTRSYILKKSLGTNSSIIRIGSIGERLNDIHAYHQNQLDSGPNGCGNNNGGCSVFCIPLPSNRSKCACPDSQRLASNGTGCEQETVIATTTPPSTPRPVTPFPGKVHAHITPSDPNPFVTDGSKELTLTCAPDHPVPVIGYTWNHDCDRRIDNVCVLKPKTSEDGMVVTCVVTLLNGTTTTAAGYHISLSYPPPTPPVISGYSGELKQVGNSLRLTCTVTGGKPAVRAVYFQCPGHLDNSTDVHNGQTVSSVLNIDSLSAREDGASCTCTADWAQKPELYRLRSTITLRVNGSDSGHSTTTARSDTHHSQITGDGGSSTAAGPIVGAVLGVGVLLIIVLVVIIFLILRRKRRRAAEDRQVIVHEPPPQYQDPSVGFGDLGHAPYAMYNPSYDTPGAVGGAPVTETDDNTRNAAVAQAGEVNKVPLDSSQAVSADDVKPTGGYQKF